MPTIYHLSSISNSDGGTKEPQLQPEISLARLSFSLFLHGSPGLLSRRERLDEWLAGRPIFIARDTGTSRVSHCSKRTTQFHNNATPASERAGVCKRDANKQRQGRENGDGRGGPFYRAAAGEHWGSAI